MLRVISTVSVLKKKTYKVCAEACVLVKPYRFRPKRDVRLSVVEASTVSLDYAQDDKGAFRC